jgi:hypothetical protein
MPPGLPAVVARLLLPPYLRRKMSIGPIRFLCSKDDHSGRASLTRADSTSPSCAHVRKRADLGDSQQGCQSVGNGPVTRIEHQAVDRHNVILAS